MVAAHGYHIGIRSDDEAVLSRLRERFQGHLVSTRKARSDFSIVARSSDHGAQRTVPYLHHGKCPILRSRSIDRLINQLDVSFGLLGQQSFPGTVKVVGLSALVRGDSAALVPSDVVERVTAVERTVRSARARIADASGIRLDPMEATIRVLPGLTGVGSGPDSIVALPGEYRLLGTFWLDDDVAPDERRSVKTVRLMRCVAELGGFDPQVLLEAVANLSDLSSPTGLLAGGRNVAEPLRILPSPRTTSSDAP